MRAGWRFLLNLIALLTRFSTTVRTSVGSAQTTTVALAPRAQAGRSVGVRVLVPPRDGSLDRPAVQPSSASCEDVDVPRASGGPPFRQSVSNRNRVASAGKENQAIAVRGVSTLR